MTIFTQKSAKTKKKQQFLLVENRPKTQIEITIDIFVGRTFRIVTIVQLQSLQSSSRIFGGVSGGFYYPCRVLIKLLFVRIQEETETVFSTTFSFLAYPELNLINIEFFFRV